MHVISEDPGLDRIGVAVWDVLRFEEIRRELQKLGCEVCDLTQPRATIPSMPAGRNCSPGGAQ